MRTLTAKLVSTAPYSQSKYYRTKKLDREIPADYEARTWRDRLHTDHEGNVFIPPMAFKNCLSEAAKFLSIQIQGKGKATYTKHFEAGITVMEQIFLPLKRDDVDHEWLFVPADGRRGSGKRVDKCFPLIHSWEAEVPFLVFDEIITKKIFEQHLEAAGQFIGIGRFRPRNNGYYGRFAVKGVKES